MELQNQVNGDWSRYLYYQQSLEFNTNENHNLLFNECSSMRMDGNSNPYCSSWMHSYSGSFAMDARLRLESLKSGSSSPVSNCTMNGTMYSYNYSKDIWDTELNDQTALDSVELLDIEQEDVPDEESWLYVSPKKHAFMEKTEPALSWCRHVLDNRSLEMEAACRQLINRLNLRLNSQYRHGALQQTGITSVESSVGQISINTTISTHSFGYSDVAPDVTGYRLQNITDVYDMARLQEASLRQDYVYTPRTLESPLTLPSCFSTTETNTGVDNITHGNKTETSSSRSPDLSSTSQSPTAAAGQNCQSPKLARLHQQVTQFKLLKRAQNQGSSSRSSSPLRTSLRSLQAVRSSRSLDIDDYDIDQIIHPRLGISSRTDPSSRSSSNLNSFLDSVKDVPVRSTAVKRCQRSHSLSPCRIPHPSVTAQSRVFASPERSTAAAWPRNARHSQR